jgi:hypothetical protein
MNLLQLTIFSIPLTLAAAQFQQTLSYGWPWDYIVVGAGKPPQNQL